MRAQLLAVMRSGNERRHETPVAEPLDDDVYADDEVVFGDADGPGFDV